MKKLFLFCALLAGIAVMTGCQKDQDVVTLKAVMDQDTKAYFGGSTDSDGRLNLPYWDEDDLVYVKGQGFARFFGLTNPDTDPNATFTTFATIKDVPVSSVYCAIYPGSTTLKSMGDPSASGTTATIYFDPHQFYKWENNRQRVDMPMGAVTTATDKTLIFKNLCSILRLNVSNSLASTTDFADVDFDVMRLTVRSFGAYVAGNVSVTLYEDDVPDINESTHQAADNVLSVYDPNGHSMGTIYHSNANNHPTSKSFDIIVPPFTANRLILEVEMYKHNTDGSMSERALGFYADTIDNPASVGRNMIIPIDMSVDDVYEYDYAYLESGPEFNKDIDSLISIIGAGLNVTSIKINHYDGGLTREGLSHTNQWDENTTPSGWVELQASNSPHKIYGYLTLTEGQYIVEINTFASEIYAHSNCRKMFANLTTIQSIGWTTEVQFVTEDVTDMSYMFAGCTSFSNAWAINSFNTTNVTNMSHMFEGCRGYTQPLTLTLNTHQVSDTGMVAMFKDCSGLRTLNLNTFTTEHVTSMRELFYGCELLKELNINNYTISSSDTLTNMFFHLNSRGNNWDPSNQCAIYCSDNVYNAVHATGANTGIDETKVRWPNQQTNQQ